MIPMIIFGNVKSDPRCSLLMIIFDHVRPDLPGYANITLATVD